MTRSRYLTASLLVVAIAAAGYFALQRPSAVPDVPITTLAGERFSPAGMRGKVLIVNFWATTCTVCMKEMPAIVRTHEKFRAQGLETVAVAMGYDRPDLVVDYAARAKLPFKVALDLHGVIAKAFGDVELTPTTFVVDRRGRIVKRYVGEPDFAELERLVQAKLGEDTPTP